MLSAPLQALKMRGFERGMALRFTLCDRCARLIDPGKPHLTTSNLGRDIQIDLRFGLALLCALH
jgi:hypothetical protein